MYPFVLIIIAPLLQLGRLENMGDGEPKKTKPYCLLPSQTIEGIKICGYLCLKVLISISVTAHSFFLSEMIQFLLSNDEVKFVLIERFNQDPLVTKQSTRTNK